MNIRTKNILELILLILLVSIVVIFDIITIIDLLSKYIELGTLEAFSNWLLSDGGEYKGSHYSKGVSLLFGIVVQIPILIILIRKIKIIKIE
jgi:hypothetical protein